MYLTVFWTVEAFSVEPSVPKVLLSMKTARIFGSQASGGGGTPSALCLRVLRACMQQTCQPHPACVNGGTSSWECSHCRKQALLHQSVTVLPHRTEVQHALLCHERGCHIPSQHLSVPHKLSLCGILRGCVSIASMGYSTHKCGQRCSHLKPAATHMLPWAARQIERSKRRVGARRAITLPSGRRCRGRCVGRAHCDILVGLRIHVIVGDRQHLRKHGANDLHGIICSQSAWAR